MRAIIAALVLFVTIVNPVQARGPYGRISVAGWSGGAYTDDKTGQFSNCIASASYKSGINFGVLVTKAFSWMLAFTHQSWTLSQGQKFPIVLSFDGRNTFNVDAVAISGTTVFVPMPDNSALVKSFRAARTMSAFAQGHLFQFDLSGTSVLIPALVTCVKTINAGGIAAASDFTAAVASNATPKLVAPNTSPTNASSLEPTRPQEGSAELQLEAMQLASNFILKATSLSHPSLVSRSQTPVALASTGAAWKADNATGFVRIIPPQPNVAGLDVAAAIVGNDAKDCKGKFASARNSELVDSEVVFRGMSSCEDSEKSAIAEYFILPRKAGGFIMFSVITPTKTIGQQIQGQQRDELNAGFRKAAYTSMTQ
ncbi:hypothetical protein [Bradyrhizobium sp. 1(2017)]|uniref:hypothetical protein n=1 Tax=Bradyrhizobium sp. 1(2017) TaxID=1404888 RepID=UPI00140F425D|nr:hypothetical protein [Bradyrhizobium sp. 1(2017)]QIO36060.1 hypothetical protein HAP40_31730 [Bradyrhizobium sp. 1(2017)]